MLQASARGAEEQHARDPSATGIRDPFIRDAATDGRLPAWQETQQRWVIVVVAQADMISQISVRNPAGLEP